MPTATPPPCTTALDLPAAVDPSFAPLARQAPAPHSRPPPGLLSLSWEKNVQALPKRKLFFEAHEKYTLGDVRSTLRC